MDERVYAIEVCAVDLTQTVATFDGQWLNECPVCKGRETKVVRFRVARSQVLEQADPRASLIERTLYFGCVGESGHYYWLRGSEGRPYKAPGYGVEAYKALTPWGGRIDGGLFDRNRRPGVGNAHVFHKDDWTALAFEDNSVDRRPGSWSVFCIPAVLDGPEALELAREAFPPIFARYGFDVRLAL